MKVLRSVVVSLFVSMFVASVMIVPTRSLAAEAIDTAATETLKRMTDYLGSQKQFSVETQNTLEDLLISGHRIDLDVSASVVVQRPNKLRAERRGDLVDQAFYYDGQNVTLYNPSNRVYATKPVPGAFEDVFMYMYETLGFAVPVSDLIYEDAFPLLMQDVTLALVVGRSVINDKACAHLLFSRPGVAFQIWISEGEFPLPLKYVVTDRTLPIPLSITTFLNNWNVEPAIDENEFSFTPPEGVEQINFLPL